MDKRQKIVGRFAITTQDSTTGRPVKLGLITSGGGYLGVQLHMTPEEARAVAAQLIEAAYAADGKLYHLDAQEGAEAWHFTHEIYREKFKSGYDYAQPDYEWKAESDIAWKEWETDNASEKAGRKARG